MTTEQEPTEGTQQRAYIAWILHPLFFRVWTIYGGVVVAGYSLWAMYEIAWWVQPAYMLLLFILLATTCRDRCSRCRHFKSWHCGGVGILAGQFTNPRTDAMGLDELRFHHGVLWGTAITTVLALFYLGWPYGLVSVAWLIVAMFSVIPSDGDYSWGHANTSLSEINAPLMEARTPSNVDPSQQVGVRTDPIAYWLDERDFANGIPLFPLDGEETNAPLDSKEQPPESTSSDDS